MHNVAISSENMLAVGGTQDKQTHEMQKLNILMAAKITEISEKW